MKEINERLQRIQEEQAARQENLERGRTRIERPPQGKSPDRPQESKEPKKAAG
jgi:hypothetical protein